MHFIRKVSSAIAKSNDGDVSQGLKQKSYTMRTGLPKLTSVWFCIYWKKSYIKKIKVLWVFGKTGKIIRYLIFTCIQKSGFLAFQISQDHNFFEKSQAQTKHGLCALFGHGRGLPMQVMSNSYYIIKDTTKPYNCFLKNANFSNKISNE